MIDAPKRVEGVRRPDDTPLLSICIPTYNRREQVVSLVREILRVEGPLEVCVHVDGSTDGTVEALTQLRAPRLSVSEGPNRGRAPSLLSALQRARGKFLMVYDDDDEINRQGLALALAKCACALPDQVAGFIYHLNDQNGTRLGSDFPVARSNFLKLRADEQVKGDKKEIILTELFKVCTYDDTGAYRRIPSSLTWARVALTHDVICVNQTIGVKYYLAGGMTSNIKEIKRKNAYPMYLLYWAHCAAYLRGRYRSVRHFTRSLIGLTGYSLLAFREIGRGRTR